MWREKLRKMFLVFFFAHCPEGVEYLRIGGDVVLDFLLFFIHFQIELSSLLRLETYFPKDSFRNSWTSGLS